MAVRGSSVTKSRGGCRKCKQRRIKCDETKPGCQICSASKIECPGYERALKWINNHQPPRYTHGNPSPSRSRGVSTASPGPSRSSKQTQSNATTVEVETPVETPRSTPCSDDAATMPDSTGWPSTDAWAFEDLGLFNMPFLETVEPPGLWNHGFNPHSTSLPGHDLIRTPPFTFDQTYLNPSLGSTVSRRHLQNPTTNETILPSVSHAEQHPPHTKGTYLETYYRLSIPGQVLGLSDQDFVNHYFNNVCSLISCFDSELNPFRYLVADLWMHSGTVYLTIQSMAIGHLANYYPSLAPLGVQKRTKAWELLQRDLYLQRAGKRSTDAVLLSLILLGLSSSWHRQSDTGMHYLFVARNVMIQQFQKHPRERIPLISEDETFFRNAMMYWEMLASFIDPVPITPLPGTLQIPESNPSSPDEPVAPHAWTGVKVEVTYALAEIGRMLQRRRTYSISLSSECYRSHSFASSEEKWASHLEGFLTSLELPAIDDIADYADIKTPKIDLIAATDAHRLAGLLELYGMFPELLPNDASECLGVNGSDIDISKQLPVYAAAPDAWLVAIATRVLEIIRPIAISSGACRMLPLLLVASASFLKYPNSTTAPEDLRSEQHEEIVDARHLVEGRMLILSRKYPQNPLLQMLDIIKEVWQRLDNGDKAAHWMIISHEKGWQTLMG